MMLKYMKLFHVMAWIHFRKTCSPVVSGIRRVFPVTYEHPHAEVDGIWLLLWKVTSHENHHRAESVRRSVLQEWLYMCVCLVVVNTFLKGNPLGYKSNVSCKQTSSRPNSGIHNSQGSSFSSQPSFSLLYTSSSYTAAILEMENIKIQQEKILHTPYSSSCES